MAGFLNWFKGVQETGDKRNYRDDTFRSGQKWSYQTRPGEETSTLTILKVENYEDEGIVIHIQVTGLRIKSPMNAGGFSEVIGHLPFAREAVAKSVTTRLSEGNALPDFESGYANWKEAFDAKKGGVFSISVSEAVQYLEEAIGNAQRVSD